MTTSLSGFLDQPVSDYTLTLPYKAHIDSVRVLLKANPSTQRIDIAPELGNVYRGNLTGLLLELGVRREDHFIIMAVNDIASIHDVDAEIGSLYIPSTQAMEQMKNIYRQSLDKK